MPEITLNNFGLQDKSPSELEQRRREVIKSIAAFPGGYDDPDCPETFLQELALITGTLRRRTAGPPKEAKASKRTGAPKATMDDLKALLS